MQNFADAFIIFFLQIMQMVADDVGDNGIFETEMFGLDKQALFKVSGTYADRIKGLHFR